MCRPPDPTTRDVLDFLRTRHGLHRRQAEAVLAAGLAGEARTDGRARRFQLDRALELADVDELSDDDVWEACPQGVFIARIAAHRGFHVAAPRAAQVEAVRGNWYVPLLALLWIDAHRDAAGHFPFIATVGDFVVFGGTITGQTHVRDVRRTNMCGHRTIWDLAAPGGWYDALEGRRLTLGPGYPWRIWGAPVSAKQPSTSVIEVSAAAGRAAPPRGRRRPPVPPASRPPSAAPPPRRSA